MKRKLQFDEFKTILKAHITAEDESIIDRLTEDTDLINDLGIDSLDVVNIVIDIENHYKIEIDNDSIKKLSTIKNCLNLIDEKLLVQCN